MNTEQSIGELLQGAASRLVPPEHMKERVMKTIQLQLRHANGSMAGKIDIDCLQDDTPINSALKQLKPGTGRAVYVVENNPGRTISNETYYSGEKWENGLQKLIGRRFPYSFKELLDASLSGIRIIRGFDPLTKSEIKAMYKEAKETGSAIVTRALRKNDKIVGIQLDYTYEHTRLELTILTTTKSRIHVPDVERHIVETFTINHYPAVYMEDESAQQLIWIESEPKNIQYELRPGKKVSKDWLIAMANNMKPR